MRTQIVALLSGALVLAIHAAESEKFSGFPPIAPIAAAKTIRVKNGFTMDLLAAEPLVSSPVAMCYDEDGAAYVVEMLDYPYTDKRTHTAWKDNTTDAPIGRVRKLIDRDGDGKFDESFIFAEGLSWPTGICCWKGGVFVTATPDIWYLKDTNGDHRADVREKVFTGFRKYNVQAVINNPQWGLDNRITIAGGTNGGSVATVAHPEISPLKISRHDLRVDPRSGRIEAIAGGARFGQAIGDWGDRFLCNIRNPAQHVVFDGTLSARNPYLAVPNPVYDARVSGDTLPVLRISPVEPWRDLRARRWVAENHGGPRSELVGGGVFTSAAGVTIYRGAAYPAEYRGQIFTCEVANNLLHRQLVAPDGVTFKVEPADADAEFVASTDTWFRPVNLINAPDGTLHVIDMYRETIEHPWSIPDDIHARLDLESGRERGRIYRLAPPGFRAPPPPRLGSASVATLVAALENPNSWWRETAQRLLVERQDASAAAPLRALTEHSASDLARLHALYTLDGLGALNTSDLGRALADSSAGVREHGVRLAASRIGNSPELRAQVLAAARDGDIRVRYQVAFATGGVAGEDAVEAAAEILRRDGADRWVRAAALGATPAQCGQIALRFFTNPGPAEPTAVAQQLMFVAGALHDAAQLDALYAAYLASTDTRRLQYAFWHGLGDGLRQAGKTMRTSGVKSTAAIAIKFFALMEDARQLAASDNTDPSSRLDAVRDLIYDDFTAARPVLAGLLTTSSDQKLQLAALRSLASFTHADVAKTLLAAWPGSTPALREELLTALLARRERVAALLTAIENKAVPAGQVSAARRTQILANPDPAIKARAEKALGQGAAGSRAEAVAQYRSALALPGDAARGAKVFDTICAACHRYAGRGVDIGPNLETIRGWDREKLLLNILDPNREVAPNYLAYEIELKDGSALSGMITEETPGAIKVKRLGAAEETILRQNIAKISGGGMSLMPEGLEAALPPQAMADLLTFLGAP